MKAKNYKSVALVACEAAAEVMRRDVKDHGEEGSVRRALVNAWREAAERDFLARIGYHLSQGELIAVSMINGAPYNPRMGGTPPTDAMWLLSPEQEVKALELLGQEAPDTRPQFTTPARPAEVPPLLRMLPADTAILTHADFGGSRGTATARAGEYVEYLEAIMRRQAGGVFTVSEAAQVLVDARPGAQVRTMLSKMHQAYREGKLVVRDPGDMLPKRIADTYRDYIDVVTVPDVDAWLDAEGAGYRFPPASAASEVKARPRQPGNVLHLPVGATHVDYGDLAHLIADALWPDQGDGDERWHYAGARVNLDVELAEAVNRGRLPVLDPLTLGPNRLPVGAALRRAKVAVEDLREWLRATRRMDVAVGMPVDAPDPAPATVPEVAKQSLVTTEVGNSGERGPSLSTDEVIEAFADVGMSSLEWRRALTKNRQDWLMTCIASRGRTGANPVQGRWFPLKIAEALVTGKSRKAGVVSAAALDRAFKRQALLRPFSEGWLNLRADNPAWGD